MLDEGIFEDIEEIAENSAYLKAVEEKGVSLEMLNQLPPYEELRELEAQLLASGHITFDRVFHEPCGFYSIKTFLISDYAVERAIFIKDVEAYRSMRFESARQRVAKLLYQRFVAQEDREQFSFAKASSVFQLIHQQNKAGGAAAGAAAAMGHDEHKNAAGQSEPGSQAHASVVSESLASASGSAAAAAVSGDKTADGASRPDPVPGQRYDETPASMLLIGTANNPIGVYGRSVEAVKERVLRGEAPKNLFDEVAQDVMNDLKFDVFPRFCKSEFYKRYIRCILSRLSRSRCATLARSASSVAAALAPSTPAARTTRAASTR